MLKISLIQMALTDLFWGKNGPYCWSIFESSKVTFIFTSRRRRRRKGAGQFWLAVVQRSSWRVPRYRKPPRHHPSTLLSTKPASKSHSWRRPLPLPHGDGAEHQAHLPDWTHPARLPPFQIIKQIHSSSSSSAGPHWGAERRPPVDLSCRCGWGTLTFLELIFRWFLFASNMPSLRRRALIAVWFAVLLGLGKGAERSRRGEAEEEEEGLPPCLPLQICSSISDEICQVIVSSEHSIAHSSHRIQLTLAAVVVLSSFHILPRVLNEESSWPAL